MRKARTFALLALALATGALSLPAVTACKSDPADAAAEAAIKKLAVSELASLLEKGVEKGTIHVFDANSASTREKYGVIPGARLLSSSSSYDLGTLPQEKAESLVFYCSSTACSAAEGAAKRAVKSGYSNVSVLPEGIKGWSGAGQKTQPSS